MLATTLGIPLGTAQSRLSRALAALRAALGTDREPIPVRVDRGRARRMTAADRLERDLADWFREPAAPALPYYTDDIVRQATHVRQPHRWPFLERWLPMSETMLQPVRLSSPVPWRSIALLALVALAMVAGVALMAGTRPAPPAPFGLANNGLVAYAEAGDIFTVDPVTGARRQVTAGLDADRDPRWSPDGSRIAFLRGSDRSQVVIVDADGGNPVTSLGGSPGRTRTASSGRRTATRWP